jgi:uroporphyrinogen-III decarboxylase
MTNRERILKIISGKRPDMIPWIPRLQLWYNFHKNSGTLPDKYKNWNLRDIEKDMGMGTPARDARIFSSRMEKVEIKVCRNANETYTEYITPVGTVSTRHVVVDKLARAGIGSYETEHLIKRPEDYEVVEYIIEHTKLTPNYEHYIAYDKEVGDDGLPLVGLGACPMHRIMREYMDYEKAFFEMVDHPDRIERLLKILTDHSKEMQKIAAESPAKMILHGEHFDSMITPPPLFEEFFKPYFKEFADLLHSKGKILVCHADADSSLLLDLIKDSGFDMAEVFTTAPMVPCTLEQAKKAWGNDVIIWGGIPSVILCEPFSDDAFEKYMLDLFQTVAPGDSFILGVADNVMPETKFERLVRIGEMVKQYGKLDVRC